MKTLDKSHVRLRFEHNVSPRVLIALVPWQASKMVCHHLARHFAAYMAHLAEAQSPCLAMVQIVSREIPG